MATVVGPPVLDRSLQQALMGFAQPFAQGLIGRGQGIRERLFGQDIQALQDWSAPAEPGTIAGALGGITGMDLAPRGPMPIMQSLPGQQMMAQHLMGTMAAKDPYAKLPGWWAFATEKQKQDYMGRVGAPLVQIGRDPWWTAGAPSDVAGEYRDVQIKGRPQPLTPTEQKGVRATVEEIVGKERGKLWGIKPGAAIKQEQMEKIWENVMDSTGYSVRSPAAQKQIEQEFDRYIAMLNKGKGTFVLANQYQWDRSKYKKKAEIAGRLPSQPPVRPPTSPKAGQVPELLGQVSKAPSTTTTLGKKWVPGDTRLRNAPPPMREALPHWTAYPDKTRKQIWQAYENGWPADKILKAAGLQLEAMRLRERK